MQNKIKHLEFFNLEALSYLLSNISLTLWYIADAELILVPFKKDWLFFPIFIYL